MPRSVRDGLIVALLALFCAGVAADDPLFDREAALKDSQGAIGRPLGNHRFTTSEGAPFALGELAGRPVVISLIFTSCFHTCPAITRQLELAVATARQTLGSEGFAVLTVGFDTVNDTPERMAAYARKRGINSSDWLFLSADENTIEQLAAETGFLYFPTPRGFDHLAQVTVVDEHHRVYHQIYGDSFPSPALVEPLKRIALGAAAEKGGLDALLERVRLFCTVFDPASGKYQLDYSLFVSLGVGVMCLMGIAIFVVRAWRESDRGDFSL